MELKEAIELLKEMENNCLIKRDYIDGKAEKKAKAIDTVLQALENSISKDKIKEKIIELEKSELMGRYYYEQIQIATDILKELLDDTNNLEIANIKYSTAESQRNTMRELLKGE